MRYCSNCGGRLPEEAIPCPACGASAVAAQVQRSAPADRGPVSPRPPRSSVRDDLLGPWWKAVYFGLPGIVLGFINSLVMPWLVQRFGNGGVTLVFLGVVALGGLVSLTGGVFWFIFLYRAWGEVQALGARTTPGKAVGLQFVPFFNFYWIFVAYLGLAKDLNMQLLQGRRSSPQPVNETVALAACILFLVNAGLSTLIGIILTALAEPFSPVRYVTVATSLGFCVAFGFLAVQLRDAAVAINERSRGGAVPSTPQ